MRIICTINHFRDAILTAERFSGRHITLPILSHVFIQAKERSILVSATNLEVGINYTIPGKIIKPGAVTAPAKTLAQVIQSLQDDTVTLQADHEVLMLHTATSDVSVVGLPSSDFPLLPTIKEEFSFMVPGDVFAGLVERVLPAAATSDFKPELTGVLVKADAGRLTFVATDSFRLAEATLGDQQGITTEAVCIVPARTLQEIVRTIPPSETLSVVIGEHQIKFSAGGVEIVSRLIDGAYPPYQNIIPKTYETSLVVDRTEFAKKVRLAAVFSSRLNDVTVKFSPTELSVETTQNEQGRTNARMAIKGQGKAGTVMFNFRYLLDGLEAAGGDHVTLGLNGVTGAARIQNPADPSFLYLLMPIRSV